MAPPTEIIVAEDHLKGSVDLREFMGVIVENNQIMLKNLQQLKELQRWLRDSASIYK
jgi:hypothetical protein